MPAYLDQTLAQVGSWTDGLPPREYAVAINAPYEVTPMKVEQHRSSHRNLSEHAKEEGRLEKISMLGRFLREGNQRSMVIHDGFLPEKGWRSSSAPCK